MADGRRPTLSDRWRMLIGGEAGRAPSPAADRGEDARRSSDTATPSRREGLATFRHGPEQAPPARRDAPRLREGFAGEERGFGGARSWEEKREQNIGHRGRMRQRMLKGGGDAFLDYELLEYVLALAIPRGDTKPLAKRLIKEFGSFAAVISAEPAELARMQGVGDHTAAAIKFVHAAALRLLKAGIMDRPLLSSSQAVIEYLHADMAHGMTERFRVLFLNTRHHLIRDEVLFEGTINQAAVFTREVVKRALELGAAGLILVHNHPSGDPKPSRDDVELTNEIMEVCSHLELQVLDHVIIGSTGHASLRSLGLI